MDKNKPDDFNEDFKDSFKNGINADWESLKKSFSGGVDSIHKNFVSAEGDNGNLGNAKEGLQSLANKKAEEDAPKGYADGGDVMDPADETASILSGGQTGMPFLQGAPQMAAAPADMANAQQLGVAGAFPQQQDVDNDFIHKLNMGTALTPTPPQPAPAGGPGLSQAAQSLQSMPSTNPSIYQGITADDRANLMKQLLAQKASGGNLAMSGIAGLGDAISNAFGKGGQHAQKDVRDAQSANVTNQIGVMDTQRQQKMQDMQVALAQQENDPKSAYSAGMRQFYSQLTGKQFPSGISAAMMKSAFPDYAKIFDAQMQSHTAAGQQGIEAGKELAGEGFWHQLVRKVLPDSVTQGGNEGENYLEKRIGASPSNNTASSGGWSVVK